MSMTPPREDLPPRLDERGVALPLALMGLVVVSLLVTAALLTSSTELALSGAHGDATRGLYRADAALEAFVADRATNATALGANTLRPDTTYRYGLSVGDTFEIDVSRLAVDSVDDGSGEFTMNETFALVSTPASGAGRSVGAFITVGRSWQTIQNEIDEGVATGGGIRNSGNSEISAFSDLCSNEGSSGVAVRFTSDVTAAEKAQLDTAKIEGDTATLAGVTADSLIRYALGGARKDDVFAMATIKFGYGGAASFDESKKPSSITYAVSSNYNWGCPPRMVACDAQAAQDSMKIPIVAIDAGGRTIGFQGDHGQGILYIYNGNLKITGKFLFFGIIIVDGGYFEVSGTGTEGTKIEGSLLSTGGVKDSRISGDAVINYNSCAVTSSETAFNQNAGQSAGQKLNAGTYSWFEVVR